MALTPTIDTDIQAYLATRLPVIKGQDGFTIPKEDEKIIVSSDKDFYQLLDANTTL